MSQVPSMMAWMASRSTAPFVRPSAAMDLVSAHSSAPAPAIQLLLEVLQVDQERRFGRGLDVRHGHRGEDAKRVHDEHRPDRQAALLLQQPRLLRGDRALRQLVEC